ncbi:oxidoreductase [Aureococcus anophagefferens]|nr:oxidoreductase [Aureococcus anophagefferens]
MRSLSFALLACTHASFFDRVRAPPGKIKAVKYVTLPSSLANASDVRVPNLIYASAYKRHQTAELVERAFRAGFRGVDTASGEGNRFNETGVGEALRNAVASMPLLKPSDGFFVQVKVHHVSAPKKGVEAPSAEEAAQGAADRVTRAVRHGLRAIGIRQAGAPPPGPSNEAGGATSCAGPRVRQPARSTAPRGAEDRPSHGISPEQATLKFALQLGVVPVVGSTSALHVRDDLAALAAAPFTRAEMDGVEFAYSKGRKPAAPHVKMPRATSTKHEHRRSARYHRLFFISAANQFSDGGRARGTP